MADLTERHEVRIRGKDQTILFVADSEDGRLVIRQEREGKKAKDVCAITLSDPDELRAFFKGLRRVLASMGTGITEPDKTTPAPRPESRRVDDHDERDALVEKARQTNPQALTPWTKQEEQEVRRRHEAGESIDAIARKHKRSPRAIQLRLQRLGLLPPDE